MLNHLTTLQTTRFGRTVVWKVGNHLGKTTLSRPDQNSNLDLHVISRPFQHETLDRLATEAARLFDDVHRQQMQVGQEIVEEVEKTQVEQQVETSNKDLQTLVSEGLELQIKLMCPHHSWTPFVSHGDGPRLYLLTPAVTNVCIANDAREVKRREENVVAHQERMAKLDQELVASAQKLEEINARWEGILGTNDPLDLYHDIHHQRVKCSELMSQKDQLIQELRKELHLADDRFMRDQRRQKQDLGLLCERIDQQVVVMGRAYKQELLLVEDAISRERHQLIEAGKKKWEGLYKARDKLELSHMDKKMHTVQQFEQEMYKIHKENEEHYRAKKLQLETDLQVLQQELEQVKALCLLNMEKLDYNYQVLKKRDEENIIMKSQQKRRINKLQDMVNVLRRRIVETERSSSQETTRLTEEVVRLHRNIVDIENKAGHFTQVNDSKYNQLWQLNTDTARALLDKVSCGSSTGTQTELCWTRSNTIVRSLGITSEEIFLGMPITAASHPACCSKSSWAIPPVCGSTKFPVLSSFFAKF
uniref:Dynein regulatory complex protein 1/2 N-terminal domain-containing protein n=1 Tax=Timema monikensis TaxID=170555 RepID=A0A7R9E5L0_9NEOP|nr:unnamed protein product [Timema monikensis]